MPFGASSKDIVIVQGGLHHLTTLPQDLEQTLIEIHRVLRENGRIVVVEPWLTLFLRFVHVVCRRRIARRVFTKIGALATMIHYEQRTYDQWLAYPHVILRLFEQFFHIEWRSIAWRKCMFVGRKR